MNPEIVTLPLTPQTLTLEPQTPQEEPRPKTARDVLLGAARFIEEHGWSSGRFVGEDGSRCVFSALVATGGRQPDGHISPPTRQAIRRLDKLVGRDAVAWNDAPERTEAEVLSALREAARSL